jgi:serine protease Do
MGHRRARIHWYACRFAALSACLFPAVLQPSAASELRRTPAVQAVAAAQQAVVNIHGQKTVPSDRPESHTTEASRRVNGMGTGVVLDERGYILTNFHVVDGVREIQITLSNRETVVGQLVAYDRQEDLAIVKVEVDRPLSTIPIGTSTDLMLAETVIAIGNAYGYEHTVTQGIVSSLHRDVQVSESQAYEDLIQTSAPINPGNSGGPLLNIDGEMVGINVAVRAGAQNIAFAIPVDRAITTATRLLSAERLNRTWHGIVVEESGVSSEGVIVRRVEPGSPAESIGIEPGDAIRRIGDLEIGRALDIERAFLGLAEGERTRVGIVRNGDLKTLDLTIAAHVSGAAAPALTPVQQKTWDVFGMSLEPIAAKDFARRDTPYNGGLKVMDIRAGGPAERQGIRPGDILVGMHGWETASENDIKYIVSLPRLGEMGPLKFYILRGADTLYGHLNIPRRAPGVMATTR